MAAAPPPPNLPRPMTAAEARDFLVGKGGLFELEEKEIRGNKYRVWKSPPTAPNGREVWRRAAAEFADREYLVYSRREPRETVRITYAQADVLIKKLIGVLGGKFGVEKGTHVAIAMRNYPEYLICQWALVSMGAVVVNINAFLTPDEMEYCILDGRSKLILADGERYEKLRPLKGLAGIPMVVCRREGRKLEGAEEMEALLEGYRGPLELPTTPIDPEDHCIIFYTSGTTGKPKGALHTHRAYIGATRSVRFSGCVALLRMGYGPGSPLWPRGDKTDPQMVNMVTTPLFHVTANTATTVAFTAYGHKCILMYKWDPVHAMELIQSERATSMGGVPSMNIQVLNHPDVDKYDLSSVVNFGSGGAPAPVSLIAQVKTKFPAKQGSNGWGMSETLTGVIGISGEDYARKPAAIGSVLPNHDVKYVDDDGNEVPPGSVGELWIRGPQVLKEYFGKPDATAKSLTSDGWFKTGDLGRVDEEGFHYIVDRSKDLIIRGGENIASVAVENALYTHDAVFEAAVVPVPHPVLGEEVAAVVRLKPGSEGRVSAADLVAHVRKTLPPFMVPVFIEFTSEELPKNPNGKVLKRELKEQVAKNFEKAGPRARL
ncbi:AMP-dependent synthetase and ligase [Hyaloraphidium curvatum]|nr:AMP-dependent synthetase and ligase [Hyaloraphidium curvatum]